jgi:glycosyltransferase involved in cell wall biosynthesis
MGVGNEVTARSWEAAFDGPTHWFDNFPCGDRHAAPEAKDFEAARRSFLFFASRAQVKKGLDLTLEVFARNASLELFVCSDFKGERDFEAAYRKELYETSNIHALGWTDVQGEAFADVARRCGYVIHPSCSEGQAGAVVQCMASGLVPVITPETGLDLEDYGVLLGDDSLDAIERVVLEAAERPAAELRERSLAARDAVATRYTEDAFVRRFREIVTAVVAQRA